MTSESPKPTNAMIYTIEGLLQDVALAPNSKTALQWAKMWGRIKKESNRVLAWTPGEFPPESEITNEPINIDTINSTLQKIANYIGKLPKEKQEEYSEKFKQQQVSAHQAFDAWAKEESDIILSEKEIELAKTALMIRFEKKRDSIIMSDTLISLFEFLKVTIPDD